jgi:hypothetical protein
MPRDANGSNMVAGPKLSEDDRRALTSVLPTTSCFRCGARGWCGCTADRVEPTSVVAAPSAAVFVPPPSRPKPARTGPLLVAQIGRALGWPTERIVALVNIARS